MRMTDIRSATTVAQGIVATLADENPLAGNIVDTADYGQAVLVTGAGTAGVTFEVQESDTKAGADFTAVAADELIGSIEASDATGSVGYVGYKRYVRVVATGAADAVVSAAWVLQAPRYMPAAVSAPDIAAE